MRETFVKTLIELAEKNPNVELLTADLGFGVLRPYNEKFPDRLTNVGIAEQSLIGVSAGLAKEGKTVFAYSIGNFPSLRCLEQIRNDCAYHELNVNIICVGTGFVYGALGMSHHATEDIAVMRALPGVCVFSPCDALEVECVTKAMAEYKGTCYMRLGRGGEMRIHDKINDFKIGKAIKVKDGKRAAIFLTGGIYDEVNSACEQLKAFGIEPSVYTFPTIKPIDKDVIEKCAKEHEVIVTVEEHNITGGFSGAVAEVMAELKDKKAFLVRIGLNDTYSSVVGSQKYLRDYYGINAKKIVESVRESLNV